MIMATGEHVRRRKPGVTRATDISVFNAVPRAMSNGSKQRFSKQPRLACARRGHRGCRGVAFPSGFLAQRTISGDVLPPCDVVHRGGFLAPTALSMPTRHSLRLKSYDRESWTDGLSTCDEP